MLAQPSALALDETSVTMSAAKLAEWSVETSAVKLDEMSATTSTPGTFLVLDGSQASVPLQVLAEAWAQPWASMLLLVELAPVLALLLSVLKSALGWPPLSVLELASLRASLSAVSLDEMSVATLAEPSAPYAPP
jgi:hypothetical protein